MGLWKPRVNNALMQKKVEINEKISALVSKKNDGKIWNAVSHHTSKDFNPLRQDLSISTEFGKNVQILHKGKMPYIWNRFSEKCKVWKIFACENDEDVDEVGEGEAQITNKEAENKNNYERLGINIKSILVIMWNSVQVQILPSFFFETKI